MNIKNEVDIWFLDPSISSSHQHNWKDFISTEELQRANRFHFEEDKRSFIFYHACKRLILSSYLKISPKEILIAIQENGKPFLKENVLHFNLSHTKNKAILAVSHHAEVGVDIENTKKTNHYLDIAKRFFHPEEYNYLKEIKDAPLQQEAFLILWTAKEAILKATGEGIAAGLNNFYVQITPTHLKHNYSENIALMRLNTPEGYVATLAALNHSASLNYQNFDALFYDYPIMTTE